MREAGFVILKTRILCCFLDCSEWTWIATTMASAATGGKNGYLVVTQGGVINCTFDFDIDCRVWSNKMVVDTIIQICWT